MLYSRRKRQTELAAREAAGESFWTDLFEERARVRLVHAAQTAAGSFMSDAYFELARNLILRDEGLFFLADGSLRPSSDLLNYLLRAPHEMMPTAIEALAVAFTAKGINHQSGNWHGSELFGALVNVILREHRISFELIDQQMVSFESREMHAEVVAPVLTLLGARPDWEAVERTYQKALHEIARGAPDDAITDAGTALQEALTALGCEGNQLGDLIKSGKAKGVFAPHDDKLLQWVSADRSQRGDAHYASSATVSDAWLTVHVTGALILRLAQGGSRSS